MITHNKFRIQHQPAVPKLYQLVQLFQQDNSQQFIISTDNNQIKLKDKIHHQLKSHSSPKSIKQNLFSQLLTLQDEISYQQNRSKAIGKIIHSPSRKRYNQATSFYNQKTETITHIEYSFSEDQKSTKHENLCINQSFSEIFEKKEQNNNPQEAQNPTINKNYFKKAKIKIEQAVIKESDSLKIQEPLFDAKELLNKHNECQKVQVCRQLEPTNLQNFLEENNKHIPTSSPVSPRNFPVFRKKIFPKKINDAQLDLKQKKFTTQMNENQAQLQLFSPLKGHYKQTDSCSENSNCCERSDEAVSQNCLTNFLGVATFK